MNSIRLPFRLFLGASMICASSAVLAFLIPTPPTVIVVEYWHSGINHYFLTANADEMAAIDAGAAGPGWHRTGLGFIALERPWDASSVWVERFHGTPGVGPNSHFFTENPAESAALRERPLGWDYEGHAFAAWLPTTGQCRIPVYRLYNNRWMFNDSNHRYVTSAAERSAMVAAGWIDEGVHFCASDVVEVPMQTFAINVPPEGNIRPSSECEDETINLGPCIAINNLPIPTGKRAVPDGQHSPLIAVTGRSGHFVFTPRPTATIAEIAQEVYVVGEVVREVGYYAFHVDTRSRGAPIFSSVNPLYQFRTDSGDGGPDPRFFPWGRHQPFETQLSISHRVNLARVARRSAGSEAIGHPTLEFIDRRSGLHLYFTVLSWATMDLYGQEYLARDVVTGKVIVGTGHWNSRYGRNHGSSAYFARPGPDGIVPNLPSGMGDFEFRIDRTEFQRVVDSARKVEPSLSPDPADYFVDNFHFNNEVYQDGEIGLSLWGMMLRVLRR